MPHRLKHAPNFPISSFGYGDAVPTIGTLTTTRFNCAEMGRPITNIDPGKQFLFFLGSERAKNAHRVLSLQPEPGMHQIVGQFTRTGKQQQPLSVQVETSHRLPLALKKLWQASKDGRPILWVIMGNDFTRRLVVSDDPGCWRLNSEPNGSPIDFDLISKLHSLTNMRRLIVHADAALKN
jgi:hypothetical protein